VQIICPILKEDTSSEGYIICTHLGDIVNCKPNNVISEEAVVQLIRSNSPCYICRIPITINDYVYMKF
jgi:hypothetical protein